MQVKKRLQINVAVSVLMTIAIALTLFLALYRINRAMEESEIASEILSSAFERNTLRADYLRTNSERARAQWFAKHVQIGRLLKSASEMVKDVEDKTIINEMIKDHEATEKLFSDVVKNREMAKSGAGSAELSLEIENRLVAQLNMRLYDKVLNTRRLREVGSEHLFSALRLAGWSIVFVMAIITSAAIIDAWAMGRTITSRFQALRDGASVIGEGNLDYRIDIKGDDEFADLAAAFNAMTEKLQESYHILESEIDERKRMEKNRNHALRIAEERTIELEAAIRELEGFTYSVSHDLRAPIRHMASYSQLLKEASWPVLGEKSRTFLTSIMNASRRLGILIDELLEFSRAGRKDMLKQPVDLDLLVREIVRGLAEETGDRTIEWNVASLPEVHGDPSMLLLVFSNLLANAVKFIGNRSTAGIEISSAETPEEHIVHVKDNGIGFDMEYYNKLFGVFQRLHTTEEFEGTGIGLANVQRIIHRHGGRVWAEGKVNGGATFYLSLPKEKQDGAR